MNSQEHSSHQQQNWIGIQSNPQIWVQYLADLGINVQQYTFSELLSVQEQWARNMIHKPVLGVALVYEQTKLQINFQKQQAQTLNYQHFQTEQQKITNQAHQLYYMKQYAHNACGSIAIYHIILNQLSSFPNLVLNGSLMSQFYQQTKQNDAEERGKKFQENQEIKKLHLKYSNEGQSEIKEEVEEHYIAFVSKQGRLYELDGCKVCPVDHGVCEDGQILERSCEVIREFMGRDPENINFNVMVLHSVQSQKMEQE